MQSALLHSSSSALYSTHRRASTNRRVLRCMPAQAISKPPTTTSSKSPVQPPTVQPTALKTSVDRFFQRYDFLSAGMGAMVVTSFCFARGQDVSTALWISAAATIGAVVLNELLFSQEES